MDSEGENIDRAIHETREDIIGIYWTLAVVSTDHNETASYVSKLFDAVNSLSSTVGQLASRFDNWVNRTEPAPQLPPRVFPVQTTMPAPTPIVLDTSPLQDKRGGVEKGMPFIPIKSSVWLTRVGCRREAFHVSQYCW